MSQSLEFNQLTVLLMLIHIGILTETSVVPIAYIPDETIVKPCRSGTADCMFGDCKKIWMRKVVIGVISTRQNVCHGEVYCEQKAKMKSLQLFKAGENFVHYSIHGMS
uniref:Uncharacterized protein n=1 Tax=Trichobilharzia regenti TaxID=157069 RepID=A0AA85IT81_TRIRE|nr:unnamed protein product [Trichobilharzia regenti]